jgi:hypothetical protein
MVLFLVITKPTIAVCRTMSELILVCNVTDMMDVWLNFLHTVLT